MHQHPHAHSHDDHDHDQAHDHGHGHSHGHGANERSIGLAAVLLASILRNTLTLYQQERLP